MRYAVTGATGFIGGRLARRLLEEGHDVTAPVRRTASARDLADAGADVIEGDILDPSSMRAAFDGVDGVFHLAAMYTLDPDDPDAMRRVNVDGTRNVLEAVEALDVAHCVYTSSLAVFGDTRGRVPDETFRPDGTTWTSLYDETKAAAHYDVALPMMERGVPVTIVQPGVVYGPGDTSAVRPMFVQYLRGKLRAIPSRTAYCWSLVDDVVDGHVLAMEKGTPGETYIIAGEPRTVADVFDVAEAITGVPAPRLHVPPWVLKAAGSMMRSEALKAMAGATYLGSNARARAELGYAPRPIEEGLPPTLEHEMALLADAPEN